MKIFRKLIALFCCVAFVMASTIAVYAKPIANENLLQYTVLTKSYETGEVTSKVIPSVTSSRLVPRFTPARMPSEEAFEILNTSQENLSEVSNSQENVEIDPRPSDESQFPYCAIGRIETIWRLSDTQYKRIKGTGFLEGPDVVLTCAHILWDEELGWGTETWFYPGQTFDSVSGRTIQSKAVRISIAQSYASFGTDDWAIIQVEDDLGYLGWFGKGEATSALVGIEMISSGYRGDMFGQQWQTDGYVERVAADYDSWIMHLSGVNASEGHSGAPIYDDDCIVWSLFNFGGGLYDGGGRAIDPWLYDMLQEAYLESIERWEY